MTISQREYRAHINMNQNDRDQLNELQRLTGMNATDAIKWAIRLALYIKQEQAQQSTFTTHRADGTKHEIVIL